MYINSREPGGVAAVATDDNSHGGRPKKWPLLLNMYAYADHMDWIRINARLIRAHTSILCELNVWVGGFLTICKHNRTIMRYIFSPQSSWLYVNRSFLTLARMKDHVNWPVPNVIGIRQNVHCMRFNWNYRLFGWDFRISAHEHTYTTCTISRIYVMNARWFVLYLGIFRRSAFDCSVGANQISSNFSTPSKKCSFSVIISFSAITFPARD